jgi:hypothetical protein
VDFDEISMEDRTTSQGGIAMTLSVRHHSSETTPARKGRFAHLDWVTPLTDVEDGSFIVQ